MKRHRQKFQKWNFQMFTQADDGNSIVYGSAAAQLDIQPTQQVYNFTRHSQAQPQHSHIAQLTQDKSLGSCHMKVYSIVSSQFIMPRTYYAIYVLSRNCTNGPKTFLKSRSNTLASFFKNLSVTCMLTQKNKTQCHQ